VKHFSISIHSFEEVQAFVKLAMVQPFDVTVGNDRQLVNGKNFMGMFSLDFQHPLDVQVDCDDASYQLFRQKATELFAS
jgi:hypothetical protein